MHYPHWFLTRHKIWFGNEPATGKLLIARYDSRRGRIEAYRLVAEQDVGLISNWTYDPNVSIHHFEPRVRLHVENPPIRLDPQRQHAVKVIGGRKVLNPETRMDIPSTGQGIFAELLLARQIHPDREMMYEQLWPPGTIPATQRVAGSPHVPQTGYDAPEKMSEVSEKAFRLRKWMQFTQSRQSLHVRMGEEVHNYSTLDPDLYTPTRTRPWRGIWVGDYSGHGPEFLLILQVPDVDPLPPDGPTPPTQDDEDRRIYSGELLAIKLTGDPNVPRGECSFMADLEPTNFVRTADEAPFRGARIVRSMGHIAATGFQNRPSLVCAGPRQWLILLTDEYVDSQLILISNDRIAQYWLVSVARRRLWTFELTASSRNLATSASTKEST